MSNDEIDFSLAKSVTADELLRGSGNLEKLAWVNSKLKKSDLYLLQDGKNSKCLFQEAVSSYINGQNLAAIALGYSFIERAIAGRFWHIGKRSIAKGKSEKLLESAQKQGWITKGELIALNNQRDVRNYVLHFKAPKKGDEKISKISSFDIASVGAHKNAKKIIETAINVLHKTSL